jgi:hypothetical protein
VLVLAVFWPVLTYGFLGWDDIQAIAQHRYFNPPTLRSLGKIWTDFTLFFYVPVTYTVWWLLAVFAYEPRPSGVAAAMDGWPFHAANLTAHAANVLLLFALLRRLGVGRTAAWFGAAVFAVHPIQVEAVAWLSTLYTSLSVTFALLALMLYLRFSDRRITPLLAETSPRIRLGGTYALATLCFLLSLLTKPSLVTLPVIVAVLEVAVRGRRRAWQLQPLVPWVMLAAAAVLVTREAQHAWDVHSPLWLRPLVAADAVAFYLWKFFLPLELTPVYGRTPTWLEQSGWALRLTWLVPVVLVVAAVCLRRRAPWFLTALVILLIALAHNLGLVTFNYQRYSTVADRYFYPAMAVMAWFVAAAIQRFKGKSIVGVAATIVLALGVASSLQVRKWKDMQSLFGNARGPDMTDVMSAPK